MLEALLFRLLDKAVEAIPGILAAVESEDMTLARRRLSSALKQQAWREAMAAVRRPFGK